MLNVITSNAVALECNRLKSDLTSRGFKRFMARLFPENHELTVVFDLQAGESPKKSVYERMVQNADHVLMCVLENAGKHLSFVEKKRSPKNGTVTYRLQASFDETATHVHLRGVLVELRDLAEACADIDKSIRELLNRPKPSPAPRI